MLVLLCETWTEYDVSQKVDVDCEALERCGWKKEGGRSWRGREFKWRWMSDEGVLKVR